MEKQWYKSKTIWIGILTSLAGIVPLIVEFVRLVEPDKVTIVAGLSALLLGALQVVRRTWLDPQDPPAAIQ